MSPKLHLHKKTSSSTHSMSLRPRHRNTAFAEANRVKDWLGLYTSPTIDDIRSGDATLCPVCLDAFFSQPQLEVPLKLHCGHIFGSRCLSTWLKKRQYGTRRNGCPFCMRALENKYSFGHLDPGTPLWYRIIGWYFILSGGHLFWVLIMLLARHLEFGSGRGWQPLPFADVG